MLPKRGFRLVCTRTLWYLSLVWKIKFKDKQASMLLPALWGFSWESLCFKVTLCTMKRGFLGREPLWFTTSFLWWQSSQNMCQIVDQKWWRPRQVDKGYSSEKASYILQRREGSAVSVYIAVVNEIFIVILGTQWILCWTILFATSYKPEGRSQPPSHWDNTSLSDLWWDEVCVPQNGGSSESNPH